MYTTTDAILVMPYIGSPLKGHAPSPTRSLEPRSSSFRSLAYRLPQRIFEKRVCICLHSESSGPTMFSQTTPDDHPPTPPPRRCPALITLPTLARFLLVWRRLCDVVRLPSCLVEHTLMTVCVLCPISISLP